MSTHQVREIEPGVFKLDEVDVYAGKVQCSAPCPACGGTQWLKPGSCPSCDGTGRLGERRCGNCKGKGRLGRRKCYHCGHWKGGIVPAVDAFLIRGGLAAVVCTFPVDAVDRDAELVRLAEKHGSLLGQGVVGVVYVA
jgi:hypothetical protein